MKIKMYFLLLALAAFGLQSCDKEDDIHSVPSALKDVFSAMYPNAGYVEWEKKGRYYVAEFRNEDNQETNAWFTSGYQWYMTQTDISFTQLPEVVQTSFNNSEYADWRVDDVDKIEKVDTKTFYKIEVEQGIKEKIINIDSDGKLFF